MTIKNEENTQPTSETVEQTPASAEQNVEQTSVEQTSVEQKNEKTIPYSRFKEINDKFRAAEALNQEYADAVQAKADEDLSFKEKYEKELEKNKTFEKAQKQEKIDGQIKLKLIEKGLPTTIADVAVPAETKESKIDDTVDSILEKFKDHIKSDIASESLGAKQPASNTPTVDMDADDAATDQIMKNNPPK